MVVMGTHRGDHTPSFGRLMVGSVTLLFAKPVNWLSLAISARKYVSPFTALPLTN